MANYIANKELYNEFVEYRKLWAAATEAGLERPQLTKKISYAIIQIAERLSGRWNFMNYSYRDELIGDAILKCTMKAHLFDPEKTQNPFAYLTQICFQEMVLRIKKEHKQTSVKSRIIRSSSFEFLDVDSIEDGDFKNTYVEFLKEMDTFRDYEEEKKQKDKDKKNKDDLDLELEKLPLDEFFTDDESLEDDIKE